MMLVALLILFYHALIVDASVDCSSPKCGPTFKCDDTFSCAQPFDGTCSCRCLKTVMYYCGGQLVSDDVYYNNCNTGKLRVCQDPMRFKECNGTSYRGLKKANFSIYKIILSLALSDLQSYSHHKWQVST